MTIDAAGCAGLTNLRELSLEGCEKVSSVASLCGMRRLRALNLKRCNAVSGLQLLSGLAAMSPCLHALMSSVISAYVLHGRRLPVVCVALLGQVECMPSQACSP